MLTLVLFALLVPQVDKDSEVRDLAAQVLGGRVGPARLQAALARLKVLGDGDLRSAELAMSVDPKDGLLLLQGMIALYQATPPGIQAELQVARIEIARGDGPSAVERLQKIGETKAAYLESERTEAARLLKEMPRNAARRPEPAPAAREEAEKIIRELFKADYARRKPEELQALARKLLQQGRDTKDDPTARFVLLDEARDVAAQAGDVGTALEAADLLGSTYAVDGIAMKTSILLKGSLPKGPEAGRAMAEHCLELIDECIAADTFDSVSKLGSRAESSARQAQSSDLFSQAQARLKEVSELARQHGRIKESVKALAADPEDPAANLEVGRYLCLFKGDWVKGLPHLAKGSDAALKEAAGKDMATPPAPVEAADAWYELAQKEKVSAAKARLFERALHAYERDLPELKGLTKVRVEKQIETIQKAAPGGARAGLVFWVEPGKDPSNPFREFASGAKADNNGGKLVDAGTRALSFSSAWVNYAASEAVKGIERQGSVFAWIKADAYAFRGGIVNRGEGPKDDFGLWVSLGHGGAFINWPESTWPSALYLTKATLAPAEWTHLGYTWNEKTLTLYVDGRRDSDHPLTGGVPIKRGGVISVGSNPPGGHEYYTGLVGAVHLYNRALSPAEAAQLYMSARAKFGKR